MRDLSFLFIVLFCLNFRWSSAQIITSDQLIALEEKIDSVIQSAIDSSAFPGCQLLIGTSDSVYIHKSYGYFTYDKKRPVGLEDLYDLASITKVTTGLLLIMKMVDAGLISLDEPIKSYLPHWKRSNKKNLTLREILAHQAGLEPYIVFWENTLKEDGTFKKNTFYHQPKSKEDILIAPDLYLHKDYKKKMWTSIKKSPISKSTDRSYRYSGLFFLMMPEMIEHVLQTDFSTQLHVNIYKKLGLQNTSFRPLEIRSTDRIAPTEVDTFLRNQLIQGYVHDEAAAMLNSKSCNAGLFSNTSDLARIFQMLMNDGVYDHKQILSKEVVHEFTSYQYPYENNRRGLGFDKPLLEYEFDKAYIAKSATPESFGHSGFTGTFVWADPTADLLIVLLSNRVHPDRSFRKLYELNIRPTLHQLCYDHWLMSDQKQ